MPFEPISLLGVSIPIFWLVLLLLNIFYLRLDWFPAGGEYSDYYLINGYAGVHWILDIGCHNSVGLRLPDGPALAHRLAGDVLAFGTIALIIRIMRSSMLEVVNQDYVKAARAKGLPESTVIRGTPDAMP